MAGILLPVESALAAKLEQKDYRVYAVCGDGEIQEANLGGSHVCADCNFAGCLIVDNNGLQIHGRVG